ncbi:MAG: TlpA disulfide reductase family protein [Verrucomicrobiota bacterium]
MKGRIFVILAVFGGLWAESVVGATFTVTFGPGEGQPAEYEEVILMLLPIASKAKATTYRTDEKAFTHTFEGLKPGRYLLITSTIPLEGNLIEPQPGMFRHHLSVAIDEEDTAEKMKIEHEHFDLETLEGGGVVEGKILRNNGEPIAGKKVKVAASMESIGSVIVGEAETDEAGVFRLDGVSEDAEQRFVVADAESADIVGVVTVGEVAELRLAPEAGMEAPDIVFTELVEGGEDVERNLSDYLGKVVVLDFWATWCGPCQEPMAKMQTYAEKHPEWEDRVKLVALSIDDTREQLAGHLEARGWDKTLNVWAGEEAWESDAVKAYAVRGVPTAYVIDVEGKVAYVGHPGSMDIPAIVGGLLGEGDEGS